MPLRGRTPPARRRRALVSCDARRPGRGGASQEYRYMPARPTAESVGSDISRLSADQKFKLLGRLFGKGGLFTDIGPVEVLRRLIETLNPHEVFAFAQHLVSEAAVVRGPIEVMRFPTGAGARYYGRDTKCADLAHWFSALA